jgi:predicted metal-dependent phosphoesterase TrpH
MLVDLHVHTVVSSPCSQIDPHQLVEIAPRIGLDAICVTEHEEMEGAEFTWRLGRETGFPVIRGVEVYTDLGDMLVFGLSRSHFSLQTPFDELVCEVREAGGVIIPCHPCRGAHDLFDTLGPEVAGRLMTSIDAVEVRNGGTTPEANHTAEIMAGKYGLPGVGGSDAHFLMQVGRCLTVFERDILTEEDLIGEIKAGRCRAAYAAEVEEIVVPELWR